VLPGLAVEVAALKADLVERAVLAVAAMAKVDLLMAQTQSATQAAAVAAAVVPLLMAAPAVPALSSSATPSHNFTPPAAPFPDI
jgi:hypothetical protein